MNIYNYKLICYPISFKGKSENILINYLKELSVIIFIFYF